MARWHSLWFGHDLPPALERELNVERVLLLARHQPIVAVANCLIPLIIVAYLWDIGSAAELLAWLVPFQLLALYHARCWWLNRGRKRPAAVSPAIVPRAIAWAAVAGGLWGAFAAANLPPDSIPHQSLIGFVVIGLAAGSVPALHPLPVAAFAYILTAILPPLVVALTFGDPLYWYVAAMACVFTGFLLLSVRSGYIAFQHVVRLKLANAVLLQKAEEANRSKSRFLANMSHELRTPLNAVIGFAEAMQKEIKGPLGSPEYREYADYIDMSGRHLLAIINDILDLSKVEAGKMDLEESRIVVNDLIRHAVALVRHRAEEAGIEIAAPQGAGLPDIVADEKKLHQVLLNLLTNAIKFTSDGGRILVRAVYAADGSLSIEISDTGIGIAPDEIEALMEPFVQSRNPAVRSLGGTGLGLPLAREFVELHGGTLQMASELDRGTTVRITLPASRVRRHDTSGDDTVPRAGAA